MKPLTLFALFISTLASAQDISTLVNSELPQLVSTYKELHQHPELSHQEKQTSALRRRRVAQGRLSPSPKTSASTTDGTQAYGVVAVMKNGTGPTVLVRTDMDALPVEEKTGLTVRQPCPLEEPGRRRRRRDARLRTRHPHDHPDRRRRDPCAVEEPMARHPDPHWPAFGRDAWTAREPCSTTISTLALASPTTSSHCTTTAAWKPARSASSQARRSLPSIRSMSPCAVSAPTARARRLSKDPGCSFGRIHPGDPDHRQPPDSTAGSGSRDRRRRSTAAPSATSFLTKSR